jgi:hypothetical protein
MIYASVEGLDFVVAGLEQTQLNVRQGAYQGVLKALNAAFKACATMIGPEDHSLKALAELGHPYGETHPSQIHDPDSMVHVQSGAYLRALRKNIPRGANGTIIAGSVGIGEELQSLDRWLQTGTHKMRARPWARYVVEHFGEDFLDIIAASIAAAIERRAA